MKIDKATWSCPFIHMSFKTIDRFHQPLKYRAPVSSRLEIQMKYDQGKDQQFKAVAHTASNSPLI